MQTNYLKNFFLIVVGVILPFQVMALPQNDVVGYWTFDLHPGFNLVSFPVLPDTPTPISVIGDQLGEVEITTWDGRLGRYRWTRYSPSLGEWTGDLFLLGRGVAYWINLIGNEDKRLTVTGRPEQYTRFRWNSLGTGWKYYAPTYGKQQSLEDLPPSDSRDIAISWNVERCRFEFAVGTSEGKWRSSGFDRFEPDKAYIAYLNHQPPREAGPPNQLEALYTRHTEFEKLERDGDGNALPYLTPPQPLVVGNLYGLPVCTPDGGLCNGSLVVNVIRETLRLGIGGQFDINPEKIDEYIVQTDDSNGGKFRLVLTIGGHENALLPGDRVYLVVREFRGGETRSNSFEIPENERFVQDINFPDPLVSEGEKTVTPISFALSAPFPNPFNDRFSVELRLPQTGIVQYTLYDVQGRAVIKKDKPMSAGVHRISVKASGLANGIYLLKVETVSSFGFVKVAHLK